MGRRRRRLSSARSGPVGGAGAGWNGLALGIGVDRVSLSARVSGFTGEQVGRSEDWLHDHDVEEWTGPRSLPLWLPASHHGMGQMDDTRALELGLQRRPLGETIADTLADERERGLDRPRKAGLTRADELELLAAL